MLDNIQEQKETVDTQELKETQAQAVQQPTEHIDIDIGTAFALKLQEFDKRIAEAEFQVASLKKEKLTYIYDQNVQQVVMTHRENVIKARIAEETKKRMISKDSKLEQ